jgi:putative membrane protein
LEGDRLVVKEGIFFKSLRQVPYERIQNLNIERNLLHKLFNVGTLQVESASGAKPEAVIRVVADEQIKYIQQVIKNKGASVKLDQAIEAGAVSEEAVDEQIEEPAPIYQMSNKDVTTFGFISHKALIPIGIVGSILSQNDFYRKKFTNIVQKFVGDLHVELWTWAEWLIYGVAFSVVMLLTIWLSSIILAFLKLYQFKLSRVDKSLHAEMGLLTKITANIPIKRIQLIKVKHSPLHRYFKKVSIKMETAGGVTEQSGITMKWIAPLIAKFDAQQLITQIQPEVNWQDIQWINLELRAWKRVFKRMMLLVFIPMLPLLYFYHWLGLLPLLFTPWVYLYAKAYVRKAGYAVNDQIVAYRHGVLFHTVSIVKIAKIQNISYLQTPFDRRNKMARLTVDTAGSNPVTQDINLHYINTDTIKSLMAQLAAKVSQSKFVW